MKKGEVRVEGAGEAFELDVKRFYIPGVRLVGKCPACGGKVGADYESEYLSYPSANEEFLEPMCCPKCQHEWKVKLKLVVTLEVVAT